MAAVNGGARVTTASWEPEMATILDMEALLRPINPDAPCGRNLEYESSFLALEEMARIRPDLIIGDVVKTAQEPAWPQVLATAQALFAKTKDLRVAGILHMALLKTSGVQGLEQGLHLIRNMLERYWDSAYPLLDADEDDDPTFRVNALVAAIASEAVLQTVRHLTLVSSRQHGPQTLRHYRIALGVVIPEDENIEQEQVRARIDLALAETPVEQLRALDLALTNAAVHLSAIHSVLTEETGGVPHELSYLSGDIGDIRNLLKTRLPRQHQRAVVQEVNQQVVRIEHASVTRPENIRDRADVLKALESICTYYANAEPSSPVPLLLRRAQRLVNKSFMDIIRDLTPAAISEAELFAGIERTEG